MPISRSMMQSDHDLSFDEDSASSGSIDIGRGLGSRPLGGTGARSRGGGGGEFGGNIGGDSYSFSVPMGTESYLRADDIMGSRGTAKAKTDAASKAKATAKVVPSKAVTKAVTKTAAKSIVRKTAIDAGLDDRYRQMGMKTTGASTAAKKDADFNAFLEESDSDEEKPPKTVPKSSGPQTAAPASPGSSGPVLSRSPAKVSAFAKKPSKRMDDASPSPSQVSPSHGTASQSVLSPRSGTARSASPSRSPSPSRRSPSPSQSARSRSPTPRSARSRSPASSRSRSPSPSGISAGSVKSPPAGISSTFGKIRQMSDLVAPQAAKAVASTPGIVPSAKVPAATKARSESGDIYTEDFSADSAEGPAHRRSTMSYEDDFEASSVGSATPVPVETPKPAKAVSSTPPKATIASPSRVQESSAPVPAFTLTKSAETPGFTSMVREVTVPKLAVDVGSPLKTIQPMASMASAVPIATVPAEAPTPVAVQTSKAVAAEPPRTAWIEEKPRPATRDVNVQVSIPVDVGVQCDLLSDPTRGGWPGYGWPPPEADHLRNSNTQPMQAGPFPPWWSPYSCPWPWPPFPGAMGTTGPMGPMGPMAPMGPMMSGAGAMGPNPEAGSSQPGRGHLGPALWALRMVDDSFRDQIDLLRQAAARHRSLLEKSRGAGAATAAPASSG